MDVERLTRVYLKIRDHRKVLAREFKAKDDQMKRDQEKIGNALLSFLDETKQKRGSTKEGLFYKQKEIIPTGSDWNAFYRFVRDNDAFEFLERRIKKTEVAKYMKEHKDGNGAPVIPPGVSVLETWTIRVRKSNEIETNDEGED